MKKNEIPLPSRIISVVDAFDIITHDRVYKKAKSEDEAIIEMKRCAGTQFDPKIIKIFLTLFKKKEKQKTQNFIPNPET